MCCCYCCCCCWCCREPNGGHKIRNCFYGPSVSRASGDASRPTSRPILYPKTCIFSYWKLSGFISCLQNDCVYCFLSVVVVDIRTSVGSAKRCPEWFAVVILSPVRKFGFNEITGVSAPTLLVSLCLFWCDVCLACVFVEFGAETMTISHMDKNRY